MAQLYSAAVPDQQFQPIAAAVPEGVGAAIARGFAEALLDQRRKPIHTHAHVHRLHCQIDILGLDHLNQLDSQRPRESASSTGQRISALAPFLASAISMRCPPDGSPTRAFSESSESILRRIQECPFQNFRPC